MRNQIFCNCFHKLQNQFYILGSVVRNIPQAVVSVEESLKYSLALGSLSKESDIIPGVTAVTLSGGKFSADRDINDLKVLYGIYLEDAISAGRFSDEKVKRVPFI